MEGGNGNDDEEPQICTVFSSAATTQSKTIFDTIAFSIPKKESGVGGAGEGGLTPDERSSVPVPQASQSSSNQTGSESVLPPVGSTAIASGGPMPPVTNPEEGVLPPAAAMFESLSMSYIASDPTPTPPMMVTSPVVDGGVLLSNVGVSPASGIVPDSSLIPGVPSSGGELSEASLKLLSNELEGLSLSTPGKEAEVGEETPLPKANALFSDAPDVPFPVNIVDVPPPLAPTSAPPLQSEATTPSTVLPQQNPVDQFSTSNYSMEDLAYDAWIPSEQTRQALLNIGNAVTAGTYFPDKSHMTSPGIIYKEELVDKVAVNMSRIFGEVEANKRQILTADNVTQDDNGIKELVKLGCYRSAINLTKRILTLYGQGPGKLGQFSKHTPHSLQLWMTRIALLVRIREFKIAESELEAFNDFQNPDMYYEYYQDLYGPDRKGSMVPFHFRLIAAEIPQYSSKDFTKSMNMLNQLLLTVQMILKNLEDGISEDGTSMPISEERREMALQIWRNRERRVLCSLANAFMLAKDFPNALKCLSTLREKDPARKPQLTSAIGRLFLQYGDLPTSQKYFKEAASLRCNGTEVEKVENLLDASLYFVAQGGYTDAFGLLKEALTIQPDNFTITNNMAVCLLYMGKVKESLALMETTVRNNTPQLLQENVILNLSTIYELENSDGVKKNALLKLISEYKGDGINLASLKMPNLI